MIGKTREVRHQNIVESQRTKFNRLCHKDNGGHSNNDTSMYTSGCSDTYDTNTSTTGTTTTTRLVKNLSSTPITKACESMLAYGPKYPMTPLYSYNGEYIIAVEEVSQRPKPKVGEELRSEAGRVLKCPCLSPNPASAKMSQRHKGNLGMNNPGSYWKQKRGDYGFP